MGPSPDPLSRVQAAMRPRIRYALGSLLEAFDSAADSKRNPKDFAVEIAELRAGGVRTTDLRWLVSKGYARHAIEKTKPGGKPRVFGESDELRFSASSCFVLTEAGVTAAHMLQAEQVLSVPQTPYWDDANHTLFWQGRAIKHFRAEAPYQEAIVRA